MRKNQSISFLIITCALLSINTWAKDNAVILMYHHVSAKTPSVTSVLPDIFRQHMQYLADNYQVLALQKVIESLKKNKPLPDRTVVITFDDGYDNIFDNAHPILKEFSFPYTIFVNPPLIGEVDYQLSWHQVKLMSKEGASFANHGNQHTHLLTKEAGESEKSWLKRSMQYIDDAENVLAKNVGYSLKYFSYPYGEFDKKLKSELIAQGYIGFGQHSGAIASHSDFGSLPRYPAAGMYSNLQTLKVKLDSLAMPVTNILPDDPKLEVSNTIQEISFKVGIEDLNPRKINCFQNSQALTTSLVRNTISVNIQAIDKPGRHRVNCTAPSLREKGRFYWFSQPLFKPTADGSWLD